MGAPLSPWWQKMELKNLFHYCQLNHQKWTKKPQIKKFYKTDPPKVGILTQNTIFKFSKTKNQTQKRPPKVPKKLKTYIRRPQIKKFYKTDPTKKGNSDLKYNFKLSKTKNQTKKRPPKVPKKSK